MHKSTDQVPVSQTAAWSGLNPARLLLLLVVVTGFTLATLIIVELVGGPAAFRSFIENAGPWTPVVYVLLKAATYVIAPLSGTSIKMASGALFGTWEGLVLSMIGDALGGSLNYWIARTLGRAGIRKFAGKQSLKEVDHVANRLGGWRTLAVARIVLSFMYDFISYAAGLARFPFGQFVIITVLGGIPITILYAFIGDAAVESAAVSKWLILIFGGIFVLALIGYSIYRHVQRLRGKRTVFEDKIGE